MAGEEWVEPRYGAGCFADIPQTLRYWLGCAAEPGLPPALLGDFVGRQDKVVLVFADAFGQDLCGRCQGHPLLERFRTRGHSQCITAQFPSTTSAHVTCAHTGLAPGQSGIFEWQYYEPELDRLIVPLLFSPAGEKERNRLDIAPEKILPTHTLYQQLASRGVRSLCLQPRAHLESPYAQTTFAGAEVLGYRTLAEALVELAERLVGDRGPAYYFLYFDGIDSVGHARGPQAPHFQAEADAFLTLVERFLAAPLQGRLQEALLVLTADHGMAPVDPAKTIYLNRDPALEGIERFLRRSARGELLVPAGSCRDLFLYIREGLVEQAHAFLGAALEGRARVHSVDELAARGFFGPQPFCARFRERAGDLVVLPERGESVWWYEKGRFEQKYRGFHGGLSAEEMEIPLLLWDFSG